MYKSFKLSERKSIAFHTFGKQMKQVSPVYKIGFHKWHDDLNSITFYSIVFPFRFRIIFDIRDKHPMGHSKGEKGFSNSTPTIQSAVYLGNGNNPLAHKTTK